MLLEKYSVNLLTWRILLLQRTFPDPFPVLSVSDRLELCCRTIHTQLPLIDVYMYVCNCSPWDQTGPELLSQLPRKLGLQVHTMVSQLPFQAGITLYSSQGWYLNTALATLLLL